MFGAHGKPHLETIQIEGDQYTRAADSKSSRGLLKIWKEMAEIDELFAYRELAMYYEHRTKQYEEARKIAEEGWAVSMNVSSFYEKDFVYRLDRLRRKIKRKRDKRDERDKK